MWGSVSATILTVSSESLGCMEQHVAVGVDEYDPNISLQTESQSGHCLWPEQKRSRYRGQRASDTHELHGTV